MDGDSRSKSGSGKREHSIGRSRLDYEGPSGFRHPGEFVEEVAHQAGRDVLGDSDCQHGVKAFVLERE